MIARLPSTRHITADLTRTPGRLGRFCGVALTSILALFTLGSLGGCLRIPDGQAPMCKATSDCDQAHGEVCEEGVCWGNPPPGPFAAVILPPSTRQDLVPREIPEVAIPDFGWTGDLALEPPLLFSGRIVASCPLPVTGCDATAAGATVTVSRRSQFQGGPGFETVANIDPGGDSFAIPVPRTGMGDDPYTVTIVPSDGPQTGTAVPPRRLHVTLTEATPVMSIELGGLDLPIISGTLTNGLGQGLPGYRVAALGRWEPGASPTEVSSVDVTDTSGGYAVTLSGGLTGTVELVARPPSGSTAPTAPTIHIANIDATKSSQRDITQPATLGAPIRVVIGPVNGVDHGGTISPVRGATVKVTGGVTGALTDTLISFTLSVEQLTGNDGMVALNLLDGAGIAGSYRLSITPPASSPLGVLFDQQITLGQSAEQRLAPRVPLRGKIVDNTGKPLTNATVTARPSLRFLWTLDTAPQAFVSVIPPATAVTPETGEFVVWVDRNVAQVWGHYDLLIEPPTTALAPTYIKAEVEIPPDAMLDAVTLGEIVLPDAAFVHGRITGPDGEPVENAELKLYLVSNELSLCKEVAHAPPSCPIPSQLQGRNTSDGKGTVRLVLPR
jgi:hypothetical protein